MTNTTHRAAPAILIVDDSSSLRSVLRGFFNNEGYRVVGDLSHGKGVAEAVAELKPDIVCLDNDLPDGRGIDILKSIHADHPLVAVVMITGDEDEELQAQAAEAGAAGFLRKPFSQEAIGREIGQIVQLRSLNRRHATKSDEVAKKARARGIVADDSPTMRKLLAAILANAGIEIVGEAGDGKQALALVADLKPEIVCLDIDMPVMNGLEALAAIHRDHPDTHVLMVTASADRSSVRQAIQGGAKGYILKPLVPEKVAETIDKLLA
jgi:two-component system chemotaxis response regulator CheY